MEKDVSTPSQGAGQWRAWAPYLAFLIGLLLVLLLVFSGESHKEQPESNSLERPLKAMNSNTQPTALQAMTETVNGGASTVGAPAQADPFKLFLEAHKDIAPPPPNHQAEPLSPKEIQDQFKAAIKKADKPVSLVYPFTNTSNPNSTEPNGQSR